jgi:hypothetical protein
MVEVKVTGGFFVSFFFDRDMTSTTVFFNGTL